MTPRGSSILPRRPIRCTRSLSMRFFVRGLDSPSEKVVSGHSQSEKRRALSNGLLLLFPRLGIAIQTVPPGNLRTAPCASVPAAVLPSSLSSPTRDQRCACARGSSPPGSDSLAAVIRYPVWRYRDPSPPEHPLGVSSLASACGDAEHLSSAVARCQRTPASADDGISMRPSVSSCHCLTASFSWAPASPSKGIRQIVQRHRRLQIEQGHCGEQIPQSPPDAHQRVSEALYRLHQTIVLEVDRIDPPAHWCRAASGASHVTNQVPPGGQ